jgi:crotonobetainyl-CoA:carnitine CoA-transferase CaiB-like acyl-CoA transferase
LLDGVRVVESAVLLNGDTVGMLLADLGADVIKLEQPPRGDYLRDILGQITPGNSPAHLAVNRNKRSILLDLADPDGLDACRRLLATADIFIDGNTAGACDRLGIGYDAQATRKPDIIYCQYTGFGATGPYAQLPTHGEMMGALVGATSTATGLEDRVTPFGGTASGGEATAAGATHAALAAVAALVHRDRSGEGARIDVAASEAVIAQAWMAATYQLNEHRITDRSSMPGENHRGARYAHYATADGRTVLFCCIEDRFWRRFCRAVDRTDLPGATERSGREVDFGRDDAGLHRELATIFAARSLTAWTDLATEHRLPIGPAYPDLADAVRHDPHLRHRQVIRHAGHPTAGPFTYVAPPARIDGQPWQLHHPAPRMGEHTREILTSLRLDAAAVERLAPTGATRFRRGPE